MEEAMGVTTICDGCGEERLCRYSMRGKGYCCSIHCETLIGRRGRKERRTDLVDLFDPDGHFQTGIRRSLVGF